MDSMIRAYVETIKINKKVQNYVINFIENNFITLENDDQIDKMFIKLTRNLIEGGMNPQIAVKYINALIYDTDLVDFIEAHIHMNDDFFKELEKYIQ